MAWVLMAATEHIVVVGGDCDAVIIGRGVRSEIDVDDGSGAHQRHSAAGEHRRGMGGRGLHHGNPCRDRAVYLYPAGPGSQQARPHGRRCRAGVARTDPEVVGTSLVKASDLEIGCAGLTAARASSERFGPVTATIAGTGRAHYYPGTDSTMVTLVADRESGRLLGGQTAGRAGVARRTDVIATFPHSGMDIEQLTGPDLGYAPAFAPVWDPLLIAGNQLLQILDASTGN